VERISLPWIHDTSFAGNTAMSRDTRRFCIGE
jgi:hypothetical protein